MSSGRPPETACGTRRWGGPQNPPVEEERLDAGPQDGARPSLLASLERECGPAAGDENSRGNEEPRRLAPPESGAGSTSDLTDTAGSADGPPCVSSWVREQVREQVDALHQRAVLSAAQTQERLKAKVAP